MMRDSNKRKIMYVCKRCGYEFATKSHLKQHLSRQKLCEPVLSNATYADLLEEQFPKKERPFKCTYCDKTFTQASNRSRHQTLSCPKKKAQDAAATLQLEHKNTPIEQILIQEIRSLKQEINEIIATNTQNIVPQITNPIINIQNNILINNFGGETYDHITSDFVRHCLMNQIPGVKTLIEKIHFSDEAPMNRNVRLKSLKKSLVEIKKDDKWVAKDTNEALETMIKKGCAIMNKLYFEDDDMMEKDLNELDNKIQQFLLQIMDTSNQNYYSLRRRILALLIEYSME